MNKQKGTIELLMGIMVLVAGVGAYYLSIHPKQPEQVSEPNEEQQSIQCHYKPVKLCDEMFREAYPEYENVKCYFGHKKDKIKEICE